MAKQPSQGEGIKSKLKSMLGLKKAGTITVGHEEREVEELLLTNEILKDISKESSVIHRCKVLKELTEKVAVRKLEEHAVEALWHSIQDLLLPTTPAEARQTALRFLTALAAGQYNKLGMLRAQFFGLIVNHNVKEDLGHRIDLLQVLTDNGKDISYCEQIGSFLPLFFPSAIKGDRAEDILVFLINIVHFNSSFLDTETIISLVHQSCKYCGEARDEKEIKTLLELLDAIVSYSGLPSGALHPLISTLCRTVNIETFCEMSWKLLKKLVGTRLGHNALYIMCCILEDDANVTDINLLRGAIFFIGMCVWGSKRVSTLRHKPVSLLPSIKKGLRCNHPIVAQETGLSLQRLVKKYGKELEVVTWDLVLDITEYLLKLLEGLSTSQESLRDIVHGLITSIEELYSAGRFGGSTERFFAIIEKCANDRPESSIIKLLDFIAEKIHPMRDNWLEKLQDCIEKYYRKEERSIVRVKVLDMLSSVTASHRYWYEDEIIEGAVVPFLGSMFEEKDNSVRLVAAQLLVDLVMACNSTKCMEILSLLEKLINRYCVEDSKDISVSTQDEEFFQDVEVAVKGLIEAFKRKIFGQPIDNAVRIYNILVSHITGHYVYGIVGEAAASTRIQIFQFLLGLRADSLHRIGNFDLEDPEKDLRHSVYVSCKASDIKEDGYRQADTSAVEEQCKVPFVRECPFYKAFDAILNGLKDEWEWRVFEIILRHLPRQLHNKTLVIGGKGDVNTLCALLYKMVNDRMYLSKMRHISPGIGRPEFLGMMFPILAVLATYCDWLERPKQYDLIMSMELGLNSQCGRTCVTCLTICTLEMRAAMIRVLPSILVKLSQITATIPMSISVLEFLSCLKEIPTLYSNFVEEQYMSIFAIALPYTDAYKYSKHTVTLAHHVITSWFTRCRLSFRRGFVKFITKGLKSSAILPPQTDSKLRVDRTREFHEEMTEICLDMMARYTFSTCSTQPRRSPLVEFLLSNGISQTWLLGNMLVTITTSGKATDRCHICSDFGRKREAAKRAAAKVRKLLAMGDGGKQESDKHFLSRSRTVSEVRPQNEASGLKRSMTVSDCSSQAVIPERLQYGKKNEFGKNKTNSVHGKSKLTDGDGDNKLYETKTSPKEIDSAVGKALDSSAGDGSLGVPSLHETPPAVTGSGKQGSLAISDTSGSKDDDKGGSPQMPLVDKLLMNAEGSYGSIFSPSREMLFSRQSSQTEVLSGSIPISAEDEDPKGVNRLARKASVEAHVHADAVAGNILVEGGDQISGSLDESSDWDRQALSSHGKTCDRGEPLPGASESGGSDIPTIEFETQVNDGKVDGTEDFGMAGPRSSRVDSEMSSKTDKLVAEYEIIDFTPPGDDRESIANSEPQRPSLSETICNCACEGWAEIMIRRPCGNISWITKIENRRVPEWNTSLIADIAGLATLLEYEERASQTDQSLDSSSTDKHIMRPTPLNIDDITKQGRNTRSSSDSTRQSDQDVIPSVLPRPRRRFSTGSLDIPGAFKFNIPSPDPTILTPKEDDLGTPLQGRSFFEKPSVGLSPMTSFQNCGEWNHFSGRLVRSGSDEAMERKQTSTDGAIDIPKDEHKDINDISSEHSPKLALRKSLSGPTVVPASLPLITKSIIIEDCSDVVAGSNQRENRDTIENVRDVGLKSTKTRKTLEPTSSDRTILPQNSKKNEGTGMWRPRGKTVSAIPMRKSPQDQESSIGQSLVDESWQGASNPHFLFLQLFYSPFLSGSMMYRPLLLEAGEVIDRAVKILDGIPSFDTHKIGVLYVGRGQQNDEKAILSNVYGSTRYAEFVSGLGDLIKLSECSTTETYTGGLDRNGNDGKCAYSWRDASTQVLFHVATMMPNKPSDPSCHSKKLHVGNNFVTIVYNDSDAEYRFGTIKGQFNFGEIVVTPMAYRSNLVTVRVKEELEDLVLNTGPHVVSDGNLPLLVRQLAVHTNMVTVIHQKDKKPGLAYGCNWYERLKQIKRMRSKVVSDVRPEGSVSALKGSMFAGKQSDSSCSDFTDYT